MDKKRRSYDVPCGDDLERMVEINLMNVISGNECTGLVPVPPIDIEAADSYNDIYDVPVERDIMQESAESRNSSGQSDD